MNEEYSDRSPQDEAEQSSQAPGPVADSLDARGLRCPEPLMLVRNRIRGMAHGELLHVTATDPTTQRDLEQFCRFMGHELVELRVRGEGEQQVFDFWIRKA